MSKFIKVLSNNLIKIEEYKNPRVCFNSTEYDDIENYCVLRETIDPFQMFKENQRLKKANEILKENAIHNDKVIDDTNWKIKQYKSILDEIREYINARCLEKDGLVGYGDDLSPIELMEILDKVKQ